MTDKPVEIKEEKEAVEDKPKKNELVALLKDIVSIVAFYLIFTTFAWGAFHIPSGSMEPTLEVGDRIFVSKFTYGYNRYSYYFDPDFISEDKVFSGNPERGDVVVFTLPHRGGDDFIKRVIGLPGDRIQMREGRLYINGKMVQRTFIRDVNYTNYQGSDKRVKEYEEILPDGVKHRIYEATDRGPYDNTPVFVVPQDHYFMMGDNRDGSSDSRNISNMGPIHQKFIVGEADITTFSLYDCDQGKDVGCLGFIPYGRFFNIIH
ncbi:signal peptidase I [Kordiimonas laminariae]|uniref:signal peptidase I n=1 Tax=Kordiimonas laminariae TaxID=2917717 RepID=UPI001FF1FB40|nr:signal peptidase I [Kordiimonas laminariae]MCK0070151.1 signal peptidase I [Kordiimonas laminariae]